MRFLLDVNALVALGMRAHEFHPRMARWVETLAADPDSEMASSSITELGFVRVLGEVQQYGSSVQQARELLLELKSSRTVRWIFLSDGSDISHLPKWVRTPKQVTDGHLVRLATNSGAALATLDRGITGAFLVPSRHP